MRYSHMFICIYWFHHHQISLMHGYGLFKRYINFHLLTVSGTLLGITNTFGTIPGIIVPIFVGQITYKNVCIKIKMNTI